MHFNKKTKFVNRILKTWIKIKQKQQRKYIKCNGKQNKLMSKGVFVFFWFEIVYIDDLFLTLKKFNWKQDEIVRLTVHGTASIRWWKVKRFTGRVCLSHQNWFGCFIGWWWPISGHWSEFFATSICWHCAANLHCTLKSLKKWGKNEKTHDYTYLIIVVCIFCAMSGSSVSIYSSPAPIALWRPTSM